MRKTYYYYDELNDDFAGTNINQKTVPDDFVYLRDNKKLWKFTSNILYHLIARPLVWLIMKFQFCFPHLKGRWKMVKNFRKGYFIFANHTNILPDAFTPNLLTLKRNYIIVNPDATSINGVQNLVMMIGAIPLPSTLASSRNFYECVKKRIEQKHSVTIYPEAHIWPYYTKIRNFSSKSFSYPVKMNTPCFALTTCYSHHKGLLWFKKQPKQTIFIDGPFYPDENLPKKEAMQKLRDEIYHVMVERTEKYSTYSYNTYIKMENKDPNK